MNMIEKRRLQNLVQILRDVAKDKKLRDTFTMMRFGYRARENETCSTPACALGHYAVRRDVQRTFRLGKMGQVYVQGKPICYKLHVTDHFGITLGQANELFESAGCNKAKTPTQAANYIEHFIKRVA